MREEQARQSTGSRGSSPALTEVKHLLRDWVEARMTPLSQTEGMSNLEKQLNAELRAAGLICDWTAAGEQCPDWWQQGYLSDIEFRSEQGLLTLITHVGIECGSDDSAYIYRWTKLHGWQRFFQTEQNNYTEKDYSPQNIRSVQFSPVDGSNDYLVLTLGNQPWCESNWHDIYYRVFRTGSAADPRPLVDGSEVGWVDQAIEGSITSNEALVQFTIDGIEDRRLAVRHFRIDHDTVSRVEPLALGPRGFVEEWLVNDWDKGASGWSDSQRSPGLPNWHWKLHEGDLHGVFSDPTMHCPPTSDLWQVAFEFRDWPAKTYFLVRWRPPYRFTMVDVSNKPNPNCTEKDPDADDPQRTLFPIR